MISDNTNERLEQEARESLVVADLSAKMKQWRNPPPPPSGVKGPGPGLFILLLLLAAGAAAWWLWPKPTPPKPNIPRLQQPIAQQPDTTPRRGQQPNHYLALARTNYRSPDFAADIRGNAPAGQGPLDNARRALAGNRPADALVALNDVPADYQTDADYLRAHALFALKKYVRAAGIFQQLEGSVRYGEAAQWYEVLALLPDYERNKGTVLHRLQSIAADAGHTYQHEAQRLLRGL